GGQGPLAESEAELAAGEVRAEATMHTTAEGDVRVDLAVEAHLERITERRRVDVGRAVADADGGARSDRLPVRELGVLRAQARHTDGHGALPPQELFDCTRDDLWMSDDLPAMVRVLR